MKKFIYGILFYACLPILDNGIEYICSLIEVKKADTSKKIMLANKELNEIQNQLEPQYTNCIGFDVPSDEEYWGDED